VAAPSLLSSRAPRKLAALLVIYLRECFAYPAAAFIWVLADAQAAIILPAVWLAAGTAVGGMERSEIVTYYLASMTLSQFVTCHLMWDIADDIREGFFSALLIRPFSHFALNASRNLAWRISKLFLFVPVAAIVYVVYLTSVRAAPVTFSPVFFASVLLAHTLSYVSAYCVALTALWTTEYVSTLRLYYLPEAFLSGRLVPLSTLPAWAGALGGFLHFRYTNAFPVEILMGRLRTEEINRGLLLQVVWIVVFFLLGRVLFRFGVRQYSGVGM
jgi:ABC-2 type transport system permease protein